MAAGSRRAPRRSPPAPWRDGTHAITVRVADNAGNGSSDTTGPFVIDTVAPTVTITSKPAALSNDDTPSVTFTTAGGATTIECSVDGGTFAACTSTFTSGQLADGNHSIAIRVTDDAGNSSTANTGTFAIDTVAPTVTITDGPSDPTNDNTPSFIFSTAGNPTVIECDVDGGGFAACTTATTFDAPQLGDGPHTVTVRVTDGAGNSSTDAAAFVVDTLPPTISVTAVTSPTNNNMQPVSFVAGADATSIQCQVDAGAFADCTSPFTPSTLSEGTHTITVQVTDDAGNSATDATTFVVDTVAPTVTVTPVTSPTNDNTPTVTFTTAGSPTVIECDVDGGGFGACTTATSFNVPQLLDGPHTVTVRVTDAASNSSTGATTFTVDTTPPTITVNPVTSPTADTTPTVTFTAGSDATSIQCQVDTGSFANCTSGFTPNPALGDGTHTITVRVADALGNSASDSTTFDVDATPPTITVNPVTSPTSNKTPQVSFTAGSDATSIQCKVDAGTFADCTSPFTTPSLLDGSHTVFVQVADALGNTATGSTTFDVDATPPTITVNPVTSPTSNKTPQVSFTAGSDATSIQCKVDAGTFADCTSPFTTPSLLDGSHTVFVQVADALGNTATGSTTFDVDATPPTITVNPVTSPTSNKTPQVSFTAGSDATSIQCKVDAGTFADCTSPFTTPSLLDGSHTVFVQVADALGNTATGSTTFDVDATPPTITVNPVTSPTSNKTPQVSFTAGSDATSIQCKVDAGTFADCTSPFTTPSLLDGSHTVFVQVADALGNTATGSTTFDVDATPPTITVNPVTSPTSNKTPQVSFTAGSDATSIQCKVDAGTFADCTSPFTTPSLLDGSHTVFVQVADALGNTATGSTTFDVDATPPTITVNPVTSPTSNKTPQVSFTAGSDATSIQCKVDAGTFADCTSPFTTPSLLDGSHTVFVQVADALGNTATGSTTFDVDATPPTITVNPVTSPTSNKTPQVSFTAGSDATSIQCKVDAGTFADCTSPFTTPSLLDGSHTVTVQVADALGNTASDSTTFDVDATAPIVTITNQPSSPTNDPTPTVDFSVSEVPDTLTCQIDSDTPGPCSTSTSFTPSTDLSEGDHTYTIKASDAVGNSDSKTTSVFTVDLTAPTVTSFTLPTSPGNNATPTIGFTTSGGATKFECAIDGGSFTTCTTTSSFTPSSALSEGSHTLTVRVTDDANNSSSSTSGAFVIDTTPPVITFTDAPPSNWPVDYYDIKFTSNEANTTFTCSLNGGAAAACTSPSSITTVYDTASTFKVTAKDQAGNTSSQQVGWTSKQGLVLHYPWEQGSTENTSLLAQSAAFSPDGSPATAPFLGGIAGTALGSTVTTVQGYTGTDRPLSSSPDDSYTASFWIRPVDGSSGTILDTTTGAGGFKVTLSGGTLLTVEVDQSGQPATGEVSITPGRWTQVGLRTTGKSKGLQIFLDGESTGAGAFPSIENGFGANQSSKMNVGPWSGFDVDDLRFFNKALSDTEMCTVLARGTFIAGVGCTTIGPGFELDFENNLLVDSGVWGLSLQPPPELTFGIDKTGGFGLLQSSSDWGFRANGQSPPNNFSVTANNAPGRSFALWFTPDDATPGVVLMDFTKQCAVGNPVQCGMTVTYRGDGTIDVFVGTLNVQETRNIPVLKNGRNRIVVTEEQAPGAQAAPQTVSVSVYVNGATPTVIPINDLEVYSNVSDDVALPSIAGLPIDEIEFFQLDLGAAGNEEALCENGFGGQFDPVDGSCALTSN